MGRQYLFEFQESFQQRTTQQMYVEIITLRRYSGKITGMKKSFLDGRKMRKYQEENTYPREM